MMAPVNLLRIGEAIFMNIKKLSPLVVGAHVHGGKSACAQKSIIRVQKFGARKQRDNEEGSIRPDYMAARRRGECVCVCFALGTW
jgi:hypothetical protein